MNVLLIGSGGREHALAWKLAQSPLLSTLYAAPGNPGIAEHAELAQLNPADHKGVIDFCLKNSVELIVIGPEAPLVDGLADNARTMGFLVFGPDRLPARLEGSKSFAKKLCRRHGIPTARHVACSDQLAAEAALGDFGLPVVIKADGLAAGKGVVVATSEEEAREAIAGMFSGRFGDAGSTVVIEEYLEGVEASFFALCDGKTVLPFGSAQDYKRAFDGDKGPNTGGMGAYSPAAKWPPRIEKRVMKEVVRPAIGALRKAGTPYVGVLYAGLMLTARGPRLVEFNVRFGDPECQVLMMRLESDLLELMIATAQGALARVQRPRFSDRTALAVVMAAKGYPGEARTGGLVGNIAEAETRSVKVFQAATVEEKGKLKAAGGRVLAVTARGKSLVGARRAAYNAVGKLHFPSGFHRQDIGAGGGRG
ncbi:MAG: phosphoribosylamine--glycine ligase [Sphingomonadaceae bacterium]